jgi:hypothetical protein
MTMRNTAGRVEAVGPQAATEGALALALDFGDAPAQAPGPARRPMRPAMRLARISHGPDKYKLLEHRRRQAQMKARRLLEDI